MNPLFTYKVFKKKHLGDKPADIRIETTFRKDGGMPTNVVSYVDLKKTSDKDIDKHIERHLKCFSRNLVYMGFPKPDLNDEDELRKNIKKQIKKLLK